MGYWLGIGVYLLCLDFCYDFLGHCLEQVLHFLAGLCASLEEHEPVTIGKLLPLFVAHLPFLLQVGLIAHKDNLHLIMTMILNLIEPSVNILERVPFCDIVNQECRDGALIVRARDRLEGFLSSLWIFLWGMVLCPRFGSWWSDRWWLCFGIRIRRRGWVRGLAWSDSRWSVEACMICRHLWIGLMGTGTWVADYYEFE